MITKQQLFIEATTPDGYIIVWRQADTASVDEAFNQALFQLATLEVPYRLELWSKEHVESPKGFAPIAFRSENSLEVKIGNTRNGYNVNAWLVLSYLTRTRCAGHFLCTPPPQLFLHDIISRLTLQVDLSSLPVPGNNSNNLLTLNR